eukprot:scaffold50084_cov55-Attheya_sp.AAC.1
MCRVVLGHGIDHRRTTSCSFGKVLMKVYITMSDGDHALLEGETGTEARIGRETPYASVVGGIEVLVADETEIGNIKHECAILHLAGTEPGVDILGQSAKVGGPGLPSVTALPLAAVDAVKVLHEIGIRFESLVQVKGHAQNVES